MEWEIATTAMPMSSSGYTCATPMRRQPNAEPPRHKAKSCPQYLRRTSTSTPPGRATIPDASSRTAKMPPTPTLLSCKACWISGRATTKLCTIQWNTV